MSWDAYINDNINIFQFYKYNMHLKNLPSQFKFYCKGEWQLLKAQRIVDLQN